MMVGLYIAIPPPEPAPPQIQSTTKAEGVSLGTNQLKELNVLAT